MAIVRSVKPVKFFLGLIYSQEVSLWDLERELQKRFGTIDRKSPVLDFSGSTDYYSPEMGPKLFRAWWSLHQLGDPGKLPELKLLSNQLEDEYLKASEGTGRIVNIDPGYVNEARVILASCKDFSHRVYLGQGIYGDVTLIYRGDGFKPLEWTYPDYQCPEAFRYFQALKDDYRKQIKEAK
ncbi:MAG: hypothetical protein A2509_03440 [Candidatus Edwardsbacteria bacterium RIFOXYD12_FULL_50_11]|jgi:hypothetical protein|uniref:GTP-binding protein n=1 Tax=Candidatus Edwardsbacteria bacterium GWF2_54_11 TaxID=1817851 RepID=A0A1F5R908_9BACT|nr:MAG: hypothetical protein A2502_03355 [Candidatus Edwardsbacteria bacterium RifOxyC12_full_54_24]OGF07750.1 MAG: hypothetical protein A2273_04605 [Candidatus Edwardsbacteria bacterium RifOxyA12_full_54_48]OGF10000.1 MAG: hypothetical protein A3K15_11015 [Candidatus Edwardsbacteria bacterium GWE2_54_12]OGF10531.1 MAG: hypothetical protein A2024_09295 [Candidatus Edwardsbacteria bacterium GWF2_54_11]OGF14910.1 MAG: hypothetical protein A2509_03440 [Candidatus Edwardsbacteria bacterium RIFOXYD1